LLNFSFHILNFTSKFGFHMVITPKLQARNSVKYFIIDVRAHSYTNMLIS